MPSDFGRLIVALDQKTETERLALVDELGDLVEFYKVNYLWLFENSLKDILRELIEARKKKVFLDLKFFDQPDTVGSYIGEVARYGVSFATLHGSDRIISAAKEAIARVPGAQLEILAVTFLTSLGMSDLRSIYGLNDETVEEFVLKRTRGLLSAGCDGVITSPREVRRMREELDDDYRGFLVVTPGVRDEAAASDDHVRTATSREAIGAGADYIVVGRPIYAAADPRTAALSYQRGIEAGLAERGTFQGKAPSRL